MKPFYSSCSKHLMFLRRPTTVTSVVRRKHLFNRAGCVMLVIADGLDVEGASHGGAKRDNAQNTAHIRHLSPAFQKDCRTKLFAQPHQFCRRAQMQSFAPRNNHCRTFHNYSLTDCRRIQFNLRALARNFFVEHFLQMIFQMKKTEKLSRSVKHPLWNAGPSWFARATNDVRSSGRRRGCPGDPTT